MEPQRKFTPSPNSLYCTDTLTKFQHGRKVGFTEETVAHEQEHGHGTVCEGETLLENKSKFSKQDVHKVELARSLQHIAGHLSNKQLLEITQKDQLKNSCITPRYVRLIKEILGPIVPGLKGKTARKQKDGVQPDVIPVPKQI